MEKLLEPSDVAWLGLWIVAPVPCGVMNICLCGEGSCFWGCWRFIFHLPRAPTSMQVQSSPGAPSAQSVTHALSQVLPESLPCCFHLEALSSYLDDLENGAKLPRG